MIPTVAIFLWGVIIGGIVVLGCSRLTIIMARQELEKAKDASNSASKKLDQAMVTYKQCIEMENTRKNKFIEILCKIRIGMVNSKLPVDVIDEMDGCIEAVNKW